MDQFADKPWLKAGADLTDYFNYGFDETTWKEYQEKQRQIRSELQQRALILQHQAPGTRAVMPPGTNSVLFESISNYIPFSI
eukprot:m.633736 g.633736  ORF g.633736 m.633736 type:complete len:82 (+) comp58300_c0_seq21:524-769(+)